VPSPFAHPVFRAARAEIESLGFHVSEEPSPGSGPYAVIGGRSNARWWFIPLGDRRTTVAGLALFQPVIRSARLFKSAALVATAAGATGLWARQIVHIRGRSRLQGMFDVRHPRFAFFTGTNSPHRKLTVQVMSSSADILGYAKATMDSNVRALLTHEAHVLDGVRELGLRSALVPRVLFNGRCGEISVLATTTHRTPATWTTTSLTEAHVAFLRELAAKTAVAGTAGTNWLGTGLRTKLSAVSGRLSNEWRQRVERAIDAVERAGDELGPQTLAHGDFTSWNVFFANGSMCVFDWEYSSVDRSPGFDLLHFVLSAPSVRAAPPPARIALARRELRRVIPGTTDSQADALLTAYLCWHALHYVDREIAAVVTSWEGERETSAFLDCLVRQAA
jgi:hypothetical protein